MLFLDEPFSALDFEMTLFIREKLQEVFMQTGTTMLLVSHDLEEAVYLADQVLLLTKRPTRVAEILDYGDARPRTVETLSEPSFIGMKKLSLRSSSAKSVADTQRHSRESAMTQETIDQYVRSALALAGYALREPATAEVARQFTRIHDIASTFVDEALPVELESAAVFRP